MTIYIAFLRGINVGGHHKVKMAELRVMFESLGLGQVKTYIQSGNVLFQSDRPENELQHDIEQTFEERYGYSISVIIRTSEEIERIIADCPFSEKAIKEAKAASPAESLYVALLTDEPSPDAVKLIEPYINEAEQSIINRRDVYLLFHQSVRNSKLATQLKKLGVPTTMRNWKTLNKLHELAGAMV